MLLGRREDVDDAAADRELAAPLDQVDAVVGRCRQPAYDVLELDLVAGSCRRTGSRSARPLTCGCSTDRTGATTTRIGRRGRAVLARVDQPTQDGEPPTDGVGPRGQPLVRQRLPGRVASTGSVVEQADARPR